MMEPRQKLNKSSAVAETGDLATIDVGRKDGGAAVPLSQGELGPRQTQCGLGRGLLPYQVASSSIQPFGHNRHGLKLYGNSAFFRGSSSNTKSPGPRPTSVPSGILVHPAVWPQGTSAENWGLFPFRGGELGPHLTQSRLGRGLPP